MDGGTAAAGTFFVSLSFSPCVATLHAFSRSFPSSSFFAFGRVKVARRATPSDLANAAFSFAVSDSHQG